MVEFVNVFALFYFILLIAGYIALFVSASVGVVQLRRDLEGNPPERVESWRHAALPISILVPAHNEEMTVIESVRALLKLRYPQHELVVVNDGSSDKTLARLQSAFALVAVPIDIRPDLECKPVRGTYRSAVYRNLVVIDKVNGGKADALNCALNASRYPLVCVIDADTVIRPDALLRIVRPFLTDVMVVAVGGTICLANGCRIERGILTDMKLSPKWLVRFQVMEFVRAFLVGRLGWNRLGGNLIISGAFGLFRRSAVLAAGGYAHTSVGEDMELVVRMRHTVPAWLQGSAIVHLMDPVAFTEAPETVKILGNQRDRWQRGLIDTLLRHRSMLFRSRYGAIGVTVMPFFVLFDVLGPFIELFGYVWLLVMLLFGHVEPLFAGLFMLAAVLAGFILSLGCLLLEELSMSFRRTPRDLAILVAAGLLENLGFRQLTLWFRLRGMWGYVRKRKGWGGMTRRGFGGAKATLRSTRVHALPVLTAAVVALGLGLPLAWLLKPRPPARVVVLAANGEQDGGHRQLAWLLSQAKAAPTRSFLLWDPPRDFLGLDPAGAGRDLTAADLRSASLVYLAPAGPPAGQRRGLTAADLDAIDGFVARGGRIVSQFPTFATTSPPSVRARQQDLFGVTWTGWTARHVSDFADGRQVPAGLRQRQIDPLAGASEPRGPGILLLHEDGRAVFLVEDLHLLPEPMRLRTADAAVPFRSRFEIVRPRHPEHVHGWLTLPTTDVGRHLLERHGFATSFPAVVHDGALHRDYLAFAPDVPTAAPGPPWLAGVPSLLRLLAWLDLRADHVAWRVHAPLLDRLLQDGRTPR